MSNWLCPNKLYIKTKFSIFGLVKSTSEKMKSTESLAVTGLCLICSFAMSQPDIDSLLSPTNSRWRVSEFSFF